MVARSKAIGNAFEYRCIDDYYNDGFGYVYKSWGSHGLQDIMAFKPVYTGKKYGTLSLVHMVQCKTNKYGFTKTPKDREDAIQLAQAATDGGCRSVHMYREKKYGPLVRLFTN